MNTNTSEIVSRFKKAYPDATIALHYSTPFELLVAVILSAQCTDVIVNKVTETLFAKYKRIIDFVHADINEFEKEIKSAGFYHTKAKNILATAKRIHTEYRDEIPKTMEEMLTLPGVARKTANIVLGVVYHVSTGIPVDTHVHRISQRLRLVDMSLIGGKKEVTFEKNGKNVIDYKKDADPNKIEQILLKSIPESEWLTISYRIIDHGRNVCKAQNPKCDICQFSDICPVRR